jgi:hypothetical protein
MLVSELPSLKPVNLYCKPQPMRNHGSDFGKSHSDQVYAISLTRLQLKVQVLPAQHDCLQMYESHLHSLKCQTNFYIDKKILHETKFGVAKNRRQMQFLKLTPIAGHTFITDVKNGDRVLLYYCKRFLSH